MRKVFWQYVYSMGVLPAYGKQGTFKCQAEERQRDFSLPGLQEEGK